MAAHSVIAQQASVKRAFADSPFVIVDVGCNGGVNRKWIDAFSPHLCGWGIDPVVAEIERLTAANDLPGLGYWCGFIGLPDSHPLMIARAAAEPMRNTWERSSAAVAMKQMQPPADDTEKLATNHWPEATLAPPESKVTLDAFADEHDMTSIDFLKIDIDGDDYFALLSGESFIASRGLLGIEIEINLADGWREFDNSFSNIDRHIRSHGFTLIDLRTKRYSRSALPATFAMDQPAETITGLPVMGDAIYVRDPMATPSDAQPSLSPVALVKLAVIAEVAGAADFAADILASFQEYLAPHIDAIACLDRLAQQNNPSFPTYAALVAEFQRNPGAFYHSSRLAHRVRSALKNRL